MTREKKKEDITFYEFFLQQYRYNICSHFWCKDRKKQTNERKQKIKVTLIHNRYMFSN